MPEVGPEPERARARRRLIQPKRAVAVAKAPQPPCPCPHRLTNHNERTPMQPMTATHPVEFDVDYPDRQLDRVSTLLRPCTPSRSSSCSPYSAAPPSAPEATAAGCSSSAWRAVSSSSRHCSPSCSARSTHAGGSTSTSPSCASTTG